VDGNGSGRLFENDWRGGCQSQGRGRLAARRGELLRFAVTANHDDSSYIDPKLKNPRSAATASRSREYLLRQKWSDAATIERAQRNWQRIEEAVARSAANPHRPYDENAGDFIQTFE